MHSSGWGCQSQRCRLLASAAGHQPPAAEQSRLLASDRPAASSAEALAVTMLGPELEGVLPVVKASLETRVSRPSRRGQPEDQPQHTQPHKV